MNKQQIAILVGLAIACLVVWLIVTTISMKNSVDTIFTNIELTLTPEN